MVDMYTVYVYNVRVIKSFADSATEDIYNGTNSKAARRIDRRVWPIAVRKLDFLNAAASLNDLKSPGTKSRNSGMTWLAIGASERTISTGSSSGLLTGTHWMLAVETFIDS
jgi:hypothetical protein